ncbi:MAG: hypothetical protein ACLFRV_05720 [Acidimicrobiales bacterium]
MRGHPDEQTLLRWLESEKPARVGRHLRECDQCLDRLDELSGLDGGVRSGLDSVSAPPADLGDRTSGGVHERLAAEEAAAAFVELFALPWRTMSVLVDPAAPPRRAATTAAVDGDGPASDDAHDDGERT